jgi:exosortase D (VPLPA-CTERM-specific)
VHQQDTLSAPVVWTCPSTLWALLALAGAALGFAFWPALARLYETWTTTEEYSFGILVPLISAFLLWQRRDRLAATRFEPSWLGVAVLAAGLGVGAIAYVATASGLAQYAFLAALAGLVLAFVGRRQFALFVAPLAMLVFMLPLPELFMKHISLALQLLSSQLGVALIRLAGVSVFLDGNLIDLGTMKLQVAEACSGLSYLLPLLTIGCITAFFFRAAIWQRVLLVLSSVPITLLMNSARIALIGITSEHFGRAAAEGFLHDFEGWAVFMTCAAVLLAEIWLLARLGGRRFRDVFGIEMPARVKASEQRVRPVPGTLRAATALLAGVALAYALAPQPASAVPQRQGFVAFPLEIGDWRGRPEAMKPEHLEILKLDDYLLANYFDGGRNVINVYMGYYAVQRHGLAAHSPSECLPADGWEMQDFQRYVVPGVAGGNGPLAVNRVIIQKGETRQLVYYWFKQRQRSLTGEYEVKASLFWDLLTRQRSDGALVRLITPLQRSEPAEAADARLARFAGELEPLLPKYIPD